MTKQERSEEKFVTALQDFFKAYTDGGAEEARSVAEAHIDNEFRRAIGEFK